MDDTHFTRTFCYVRFLIQTQNKSYDDVLTVWCTFRKRPSKVTSALVRTKYYGNVTRYDNVADLTILLTVTINNVTVTINNVTHCDNNNVTHCDNKKCYSL